MIGGHIIFSFPIGSQMCIERSKAGQAEDLYNCLFLSYATGGLGLGRIPGNSNCWDTKLKQD